MKEKRKHARFQVLHEIDEPIQLSVNGKSVPGVLVDLSCGGMALLSFASVPVGTETNMIIDLPGLKTHNLKGRVVWTLAKGEMWRMGLTFTELQPADFKHINKMATDSADCDTKIGLGVKDVCFDNCSYFKLCTKPVKLKAK